MTFQCYVKLRAGRPKIRQKCLLNREVIHYFRSLVHDWNFLPILPFGKQVLMVQKSWTWDSILRIRDKMMNDVEWILFNGSISIWNEHWCPMLANIHDHISNEAMHTSLPITSRGP
jgi:hypothetical protein